MYMAHKNKNSQPVLTDRLQDAAARVGFVMMAGAATVMSLEALGHGRHEQHHRVVVPSQPAYATVDLHGQGGGDKERSARERTTREETGPHFTSYGASQRTPARAGRA